MAALSAAPAFAPQRACVRARVAIRGARVAGVRPVASRPAAVRVHASAARGDLQDDLQLGQVGLFCTGENPSLSVFFSIVTRVKERLFVFAKSRRRRDARGCCGMRAEAGESTSGGVLDAGSAPHVRQTGAGGAVTAARRTLTTAVGGARDKSIAGPGGLTSLWKPEAISSAHERQSRKLEMARD